MLVFLDLGAGKKRLGGSALARCTARSATSAPDVDDAARLRALLRGDPGAQRRRAAAGLPRSLGRRPARDAARDGVRGRSGARARPRASLGDDACALLFNEELGAVVQVRARRRARARDVLERCGLLDARARARTRRCRPTRRHRARRRARCSSASRHALRSAWSETTLPDAGAARRRRAAPTRSTRRASTRAIPGQFARPTFDLDAGRRRALHRDAARARASPSCASRASTVRSRWPRPSTAPASRRSTST